MPSLKTLATIGFLGGGAAVGSTIGWRSARDRKDFDVQDKLAFTASSAVAGTAGAAVLRTMGIRNTIEGVGRMGSKAVSATKWLFTPNPMRKVIPKMPGPAKTAIGLLALVGLGAGAVAHSYRSNPETTAYASPNDAGSVDYNSTPSASMRERLGTMGASGDMVFGLNNLRHGG